ncbi:DoxX family protein [Achromobacter aloeverae]|uniref:DoxX family protein n=1 Tax=Achromobacter aloeverae TaxID=1750518 RepID=A0A4Q1HFP4_9BURK|nr:DoxX family protein [Achromobacter aloeverae]RXN85923.1 DoxX family protein [Achromobacter aloeverae]
MTAISNAPAWAPATRYRPLWWLGLLLLSAPYLQGGLVKLADFDSALAEIRHFGLASSDPWVTVMAAGTIALELGASLLVLSGRARSLGALALGLFTLLATFIANRYWAAPPEARFAQANSFYEHLALTGGWLLVALASWPARDGGMEGVRGGKGVGGNGMAPEREPGAPQR